MQAATPRVAIVTRSRQHEVEDQRRVRAAIEAEVESRGWVSLPLVRTTSLSLQRGDAAGRRVNVLTPQDTESVYRASHGSPLIVLSTTSYRLRIDPRADPATSRVLWSPEDFFRHKAYTATVRSPREAPLAVSAALKGLQALECEGYSDPRVLPMHVFSPAGEPHDLSSMVGRRAFRSTHGAPGSRTDSLGRTWATGERHGRESLMVAGLPLPTGFHWDVSIARGNCSISNGWEVWELRGRRAYANIAPDAHIRRGSEGCVVRWRR
jgi:hypothetical protein